MKRIIYLFSGILAVLLMCFALCSNTFAIDYNVDTLGAYLLEPLESIVYFDDGTQKSCVNYDDNSGASATTISCYTTFANKRIQNMKVKFDRVIPKNNMVTIFYSVRNSLGDVYPYITETPFVTKANGGTFYIYESEVLSYSGLEGGGSTSSNSVQTTAAASKVALKMISTQDTDEVVFTFTTPYPYQRIVLTSGTYIGLVNPAQGMHDIQDSIDSGNQAEQDRYDDAKNESDTNKNNSQDSSDNAQSDVDNSSKNLLQILTDFVGAISGTSAGSCDITGDFGFFNAGNINLCSGASKIVPITTIVGTIMLVGLCVPAVITLLHRFLDLYNEVTN